MDLLEADGDGMEKMEGLYMMGSLAGLPGNELAENLPINQVADQAGYGQAAMADRHGVMVLHDDGASFEPIEFGGVRPDRTIPGVLLGIENLCGPTNPGPLFHDAVDLSFEFAAQEGLHDGSPARIRPGRKLKDSIRDVFMSP